MALEDRRACFPIQGQGQCLQPVLHQPCGSSTNDDHCFNVVCTKVHEKATTKTPGLEWVQC